MLRRWLFCFCLAAVAVATAACVGSFSEDVSVRVRSAEDVETTIIIGGTGQFGQSVRAQYGPDTLRSGGWTIVDLQSTSDSWSVTATKSEIPTSSAHAGQVGLRQTDSLLDKTYRLDVPVDPFPVPTGGSGATPRVTVHWKVSLPGEVSETNATSQPDKSTVEWTFQLADLQQARTLHAVSREQRFTSDQIAAAVALTILAVIAVIIAGFLWLRRRTGSPMGAVPRRAPVVAIAFVAILAVAAIALGTQYRVPDAVKSTTIATSASQHISAQSKPTSDVPTAAVVVRPDATPSWPVHDCLVTDSEHFSCNTLANNGICQHMESIAAGLSYQDQPSCVSLRFCNNGSYTFYVADLWFFPKAGGNSWSANSWFPVTPRECHYVLSMTPMWHWIDTNSRYFFGIAYTDSTGAFGSAKLNTQSISAPQIGNCKSLSECVSGSNKQVCARHPESFSAEWTEPQQPDCGQNGTAWLPISIDFHPSIPDQYAMSEDESRTKYFGSTFIFGFGPNDRVIPLR